MNDEVAGTEEDTGDSATGDVDYVRLFANAIEATQARANEAAGDETASNEANWESLGELTDVLDLWESDDDWWAHAESRLSEEEPDESEISAVLTDDIDSFLEAEYEDLVGSAGLSPATAMFLTSQLRTALDAVANIDASDPVEVLSSARAVIRAAVGESRGLRRTGPSRRPAGAGSGAASTAPCEAWAAGRRSQPTSPRQLCPSSLWSPRAWAERRSSSMRFVEGADPTGPRDVIAVSLCR